LFNKAIKLWQNILGAGLVFVYSGFKGPYRGSQLAHIHAQRNQSMSDRALKKFLEGFVSTPFSQQRMYLEQRDKDSLTESVKLQYAGADLTWRTDYISSKGGDALFDEQRGQVLTPLLDSMQRLPAGASVMEIGTHTGDVVAYVAKQHPELTFTGVDFITSVAQKKHSALSNVKWVDGYALDLLESGSIRPDLIWGSSVWCLVPPRELDRYMRALRAVGTQVVVISEPSWGQLDLRGRNGARSIHLEGDVWHHDYPAMMEEMGYKTTYQTFHRYKHEASPRPDIRLAIGVYEKE